MPLREAIVAMSRGGMGAVVVADASMRLAGIFTDGDLRRTLERDANPLADPVERFMTATPRTARSDELAVRALQRMQTHAITLLPVVDAAGQLCGVVRMHDLVKAQLV
jgi:arabinose-5-phosphate isomerase